MGTKLMDLSKAYNCLWHYLLIAKLETYRLDYSSPTFVRLENHQKNNNN